MELSKLKKVLPLMIKDCANISVAAILAQHNMASMLDKLDIFAVTEEDIHEFTRALNVLGDCLHDFCVHSEPLYGGNNDSR